MEFASKAVGNAGLTTGIIGTSLGALASVGGVAGLLGLAPKNGAAADPGDRPVTRYEMELFQKINDKNDEITYLKANQYADAKDSGLQAQITQQAVWASGATATMGCMAQQIQNLYGITRLMVPAENVARPFPPFPPAPPVSDTGTATAQTTGG